MRPPHVAILLVGSALLLAGCTQFEPSQRPDAWHETGAPMHNIAAELVNPEDLVRGSGQPVLTGAIAENAIGSGMKTIKSAGTGARGSASGNSASGGLGGVASGGTGGTGGGSGVP